MAGAPTGGIGNVNQAAAQAVLGAGMTTANEMMTAPAAIQAGQLATTNYAPYMNPYTQQVIDAQAQDVLRNAQLGLNNLGAQAQAARAFGGSRHGIAEAELGRGVADILGQQSAQLRSQAFQNAQQAALSDIGNRFAADQFNVNTALAGSQNRQAAAQQLANIGNLGFGMGQQVQQNLMSQGALQQGLQQALIDAAKQQYAGYTGAPASTMDYLNRAIGVVPSASTTTTDSSPGLFGMLTSIASMAAGLPTG